MPYRRGFKKDATDLAHEIRTELGIGALERLEPWRLARHLDIQVVGLSELAEEAPAIGHLISMEPDVFSAVTVFCGPARTIVHNDAHSPVRQNSNLAHELAHGLLLHPPSAALDDSGCRNWNQEIEDEAAWLGASLLVTEQMALAVASQRFSLAEASQRLAVSVRMMQFRINATGAQKRVRRTAVNRRQPVS